MCPVNCKGCTVSSLNKRAMAQKKENRLKAFLLWFGVLSLLVAYIYGKVSNQPDYDLLLGRDHPESSITKTGDNVFDMYISDTLRLKIQTAKNQGYGGPLEVGVVIDKDSTINEVIVIEEKETRSFLNKLIQKDFFEQFKGKSLLSSFEMDSDIDAVAGATVSSIGFAGAVREASHSYAEKAYGITGLTKPQEFKFGMGEASVLGLLVWSVALYYKKNKWLQSAMHLSALVLIGFYLNLSLSITNFGSVLQGYFPNMYDYLVWYILVVGVLLAALIFGKNIYCYRICPFYAIQWLANRISGINLKMHSKQGKIAKYVTGLLLWLSLLVGFLAATPSSGSYEPFATAFSFDGDGIQWFIFPAIFFSAFFIKDVFCRYYCPVGSFLKFLIIRVRKPILKQVKSWQNGTKAQRAIS